MRKAIREDRLIDDPDLTEDESDGSAPEADAGE
jgi:hypothetical protein